MKYQQPGGVIDPDASYDDGDLNIGRAGSIIPAKAVEQPMRELSHLIQYAGLSTSDVDLEQVRKAIQALIAAATGGGDVDLYIQMTQARGRIPIFPEILTADGRMIVSSPGAGTILVPPAVTFQHRGIYPVSTSDYPEVDRTFDTAANKTYHLRWAYGEGFSLKDVASPAYNPTADPETVSAFDSTYDDMLIARVITNSSNVATITNLANKDRWAYRENTGRLTTGFVTETSSYGSFSVRRANNSFSYNSARVPLIDSINAVLGTTTLSPGDFLHGVSNALFNKVVNRYSTQFELASDWFTTNTGHYAEIDFRAQF